MSDNKKYYYIKLKEDFFDSNEIKVLENMANGYKYSNLLLKLYLKSLAFDGALRLNEFIPYNVEMISAVTNIDIDTVKIGMELFKQLDLVEILDDGTIYMLNIQNYIGTSSSEADRKRQYRAEIENKKTELLEVGQMSGQMSDKNPPENRDKRIENRDKSIEIENSKAIPKNLQQVADAWNSLNLTRLRSIQNTRLKLLKARINTFGLEDVLVAIESIRHSRFLRGETEKKFTITFDWFIKPNNFVKILEGNYLDKEAKGFGSSTGQDIKGQNEFKGTDRSSKAELSDEERAKLDEELM